MTNESIRLTDEQQVVMNHPVEEHGRLLSGPGTGKSLTAVAFAEQLLKREVPPKLKFLTFTRSATAELAEKLVRSANTLRPSTFHSFSISVLLSNPGSAAYPQPLRIPDEYEYDTLIRSHLADQAGVGVYKLDDLVAEMAAKWESLNPEKAPDVTPEERAAFMGAWDQHREIFGYTLLDELPDLFRCALRDYTELRGLDYDLLVVDEYQDLNACELEILQRLANRGIAIFAVGDDDQSIYSFRKAHPAGIRCFLDDFGTDKDYKLTVCHRSPRSIVEWSQFVIRGDITRIARQALQVQSNAPAGQVALLNFKGFRKEDEGIADLVKWMIEVRGIPPSEILILYRTDHQGHFTRPIREELSSRQIAVQDPGIVKVMLAESDNRRLLAILHLLVNPTDSLAWWTLVHLQSGLGDAFVKHIYNQARQDNVTFGQALVAAAQKGFPNSPGTTLQPAATLWNEIQTILANLVLPGDEKSLDWGAWIIEQIDNGKLSLCSEDMRELLSAIDTATSEDEQDLGRYLSQIYPIGKDLARAKSDSVRLMSMTGSKGLTVRATIIAGVDNNLIPHPDSDRSEERRLLYVAMTRSTEMLFLTWVTWRKGPAAHLGRASTGRRQHSNFLRGGPVESQDGETFIQQLLNEA
jgi:DNA helicase-2/ATP-dependent DNA helicase PcrA